MEGEAEHKITITWQDHDSSQNDRPYSKLLENLTDDAIA